MTKQYRILIGIALFMFSLLGFGMAGCGDNPVEPDEEIEAIGLVVLDGGTEIVRAENGTVTGNLEIAHGTLSPLYTLKFIDDKGNLFTVEEEPDHTPGATVADSTIVEIVRDAPTDWNFRIRGLKEGSTTIRLTIIHGGHDDFTSPEIPVNVTQ